MNTTEDTAASVPALIAKEDEMNKETNNYDAVRYNAMKHGILSKHVVLLHEDKSEFDTILAALLIEHQPSGLTEGYLVEELAGIMWRKRRVLLAEGAEINCNLRTTLHTSYNNPTRTAVPYEPGMPAKPTDAHDLMTATPEEVAETQIEARLDWEQTEKALTILKKNGNAAYEKALKALLPDSREWWQEYVEEEEYQANGEGLTKFIHKHLLPFCTSMDKEAKYHNEIKAQTVGESLPAARLEKLTRYETHLDRKFERTVAMLIKLKELRGKSE